MKTGKKGTQSTAIVRKGSLQTGTELLNPFELKRMRFADGVLEGKSMKQAALDAGYSESTARQATRAILPKAQHLLRDALREKIGPKYLAEKIKEGLEAKETKFFSYEGEVQEERDVTAWGERRQYAALAAEYMGYKPERGNLNINGGGPVNVVVVYATDDQDEAEAGGREEPEG